MPGDGKSSSRGTRRRSTPDGAAAVEFALLAPLLMMLVLGVINFGIAFNVQETLTQAAREGVRGIALQIPSYDVSASTKNAATGMPASSLTVTSGIQMSATGPDVSGTCATAGAVNAWVKVTKSYSFTGMPFIGSKTLTGKAYMRCGG